MKVTIITPVSRPHFLKSIAPTIPKECDWLLLFDSNTTIPKDDLPENSKVEVIESSNEDDKRNRGIELVDYGHIYFLDDDTVIHHKFCKLLLLSSKHDFIYFNQVFKDGKFRVGGEVKVGKIDIGCYLASRELIGDSRLKREVGRTADGVFAEELFAKSKNPFYINKTFSIYNFLR
jgi:hypothetical protein